MKSGNNRSCIHLWICIFHLRGSIPYRADLLYVVRYAKDP
jgi:hypothetical protein